MAMSRENKRKIFPPEHPCQEKPEASKPKAPKASEAED